MVDVQILTFTFKFLYYNNFWRIIMNEKCEIVYVLRNESMLGLIKIGKTQRKDINSRMQEFIQQVFLYHLIVFGLVKLIIVLILNLSYIMHSKILE